MPRQLFFQIALVRELCLVSTEADIAARTSACGIFQNSIDQTIESGNQQV